MRTGLAAVAAVLALAAGAASRGPVFADITAAAGITFRHSIGDHKLDNIVEGTGSGACFFDFDNDGLQDIYFVTGVWTKGVSDNDGRDLRGKLSNRLYRNLGNGRFEDVTDKAGVAAKVYGSGCSAADYDNDGDVDLYVLNYGPNIFYRNNGDGTFTDVSRQAGLDDARWSIHAVWFDYNNDGWLDVYVANYLLYDDGKFRDFYPAQGYPGPLSYQGLPSILYRNNGDGTFTDVTKEAGMWKPGGRAMSVTAADFNNDGLIDVFTSNDAMENYFFLNMGNGTFAESGLEFELAFSEHGQGVASMGPYYGDVNRDGWLDLFVPNLQYVSLFVYNPKKRFFENLNDAAGLSPLLGQYAGWGSVMFDWDHDGWLDLFTVHGHAHHEYVQEDSLTRNKHDGTFEDVSREAGPYFETKRVGRGAAWADIDNDGDVDLLVVNLNDAPVLLRNDGGNSRPWLMVDARLEFASGSRTAIGARVTVTANGVRMVEDVNPVRGYLGQNDPRLHFGLAGAQTCDVEIRWPDGVVEKFPNVKANQVLTLRHKAEGRRKKQ
jgi:hypothetical protein